jgi:hypothetical protein
MQSLAEAGGLTPSPPSVPLFNDEVASMDATRARRTKDRARQRWYASHRQRRFARFLGFAAKNLGRDR